MASLGDFAPKSAMAWSKKALVLERAFSIILRLNSVAPVVAVLKAFSKRPVASSAVTFIFSYICLVWVAPFSANSRNASGTSRFGNFERSKGAFAPLILVASAMIFLLGLRAAMRQGVQEPAPANDGLDSDRLPGDLCSPASAIFDNGHMTGIIVRCHGNDRTIILLRTAGKRIQRRERTSHHAEDERLDNHLAVMALMLQAHCPTRGRVSWPASCC